MKRKKLLVSLIAFSLIGIVSCGPSDPTTSSSASQGSENTTSQAATSDNSQNTSSNSEASSSQSTVMYTITYYLNDGSDGIYLTEKVPAGSAFTRPTNPTAEGLRFRGWYVDPSCLVIYSTDTAGDTSIKADLNLYAKWVVDTSHEQTSSSSIDSSSSSEGNTSSSNVESSSVIPEGTTYTINELPTWITDHGCVIFAWVWEKDSEGEWIETTFNPDGTSLTFTTDKNIAGLLLARCAPGTTTPDWDLKGEVNDPGRVYNKTDDMEVTPGVTTYSLPNEKWKEYK